MRLSRRRLLGVAGVAALGGCTGGDSGAATPTETAITYTVANADAGPHDVLLAATPNGVTGFELTAADGSSRTVEATDLDEVPPATIRGAVRFVPLGEGVVRRELTADTGTRQTGAFEDVPLDSRVFTTIAPSGEQISSYGFSWCEQGRMELDIRLTTDESYEETVTCRD